jgi:hypothetical protein
MMEGTSKQAKDARPGIAKATAVTSKAGAKRAVPRLTGKVVKTLVDAVPRVRPKDRVASAVRRRPGLPKKK